MRSRIIRARVATALVAALLPAGAGAATVTPDTLADDATVNGNCTLREAIAAANTNAPVDLCPAGEAPPAVDRIELAAGSYTLTLGQLEITEDVDLEGVRRNRTFLDGNLAGRVLSTLDPATVTISKVGIHRGRTGFQGAGCIANSADLYLVAAEVFDCATDGTGGGISHAAPGHLVLDDVIVRRNRAQNGGGGILVATAGGPRLTVRDSLFKFNQTPDRGGAVLAFETEVVIERSELHDNHAGEAGGALRLNGGTFTLEQAWIHHNTSDLSGGGLHVSFSSGGGTVRDSAVTDNRAALRGGGVAAGAGVALRLENTTLSGNRAGIEGGGVYAQRSAGAELVHATLAGNVAPGGSAVSVDGLAATEVSFTNTLIAGDCSTAGGALTSTGGNLESPGATCNLAGPGDQTAVADPGASGLGDHGGPTPTHLLLPGSPAIDAVPPGGCTLTGDQRGNLRPLDGDGAGGAACDTGAVEVFPGEISLIFADGFESGDLAAWSSVVPIS